MAWQLEGSDVDTSKGFKYSDGRTAPRNWFYVWDNETKEAEGLTWVEPTPVEKTAEQQLDELRRERNYKLSETDWWALSDVTMTDEQASYRQALRDITETYSSLDNVVWPTNPSE